MTMGLLAPPGSPITVDLALALLFTMACHWGIRRFVATHAPAWGFVLFIAGWALAGFLAFGAFLFASYYIYSVGGHG